jgi:hypothetical protein
MKEIFIIFGENSNDFESFPELIDFKLTEAEAIAEVDRLGKLYMEASNIRSEVMKPYYSHVMTLDEQPKFHEIPKWKAGIKTSEYIKEMRDERNYLNSENTRMREEYSVKVTKQRERVREECVNNLISMNLDKELHDLILCTNINIYSNQFRYEKLIKK